MHPDPRRRHLLLPVLVSLVAGGCSLSAAKPAPSPLPQVDCVAVGQWLDPAQRRPLSPQDVPPLLAASRVVLLGEAHERLDHHLWQLQTAAALRAEGRPLVLAFEMLPHRGQAAVDRWVRGEIDEATFLVDSGFRTAWGMSPELYLPLFRFARLNRLPMVALNVDRDLVARVADEGWQAIPAAQRDGLGDPAPPSPAYEAWLSEIFGEHGGTDPQDVEAGRRRFIEAQLVWDRAFAEGIAAALRRHPESTVVGIIGSGHLQHGYGVPHQLAALGIEDVSTLLPWDIDSPCSELVPGLADAVFGTEAPPAQAPPRPRLGVMLEPTDGGVRIAGVTPDSVATRTGLLAGDIVLRAAGQVTTSPGDLQAIVSRQAPGTWLPLQIRRGQVELELVARFPTNND